MSVSNDENTLFSASKNGSIKIFDLQKHKQMRNIPISKLALSSCLLSDDEKYVLSGAWDNYM